MPPLVILENASPSVQDLLLKELLCLLHPFTSHQSGSSPEGNVSLIVLPTSCSPGLHGFCLVNGSRIPSHLSPPLIARPPHSHESQGRIAQPGLLSLVLPHLSGPQTRQDHITLCRHFSVVAGGLQGNVLHTQAGNASSVTPSLEQALSAPTPPSCPFSG